MSTPRPPGAPRPRPPPPRAVAEGALALCEWVADDFVVLEFLRAIPAVAGEMDRLVAERLYRGLRDGGAGSVEARRLVGARVGKDERTLQRWGLIG